MLPSLSALDLKSVAAALDEIVHTTCGVDVKYGGRGRGTQEPGDTVSKTIRKDRRASVADDALLPPRPPPGLPGWTIRRNGAGDIEYVSPNGLLFQRTFKKAKEMCDRGKGVVAPDVSKTTREDPQPHSRPDRRASVADEDAILPPRPAPELPGWTIRRNGAGDIEYVSPNGLMFQRTFQKAKEMCDRGKGVVAPDSDDATSDDDDGGASTASSDQYGSAAKSTHRELILQDMIAYSKLKGNPVPKLVWLAADKGATDVQFFASHVGQDLPEKTVLFPVNSAVVERPARFNKQVVVYQQTPRDIGEDLKDRPTDSVSHVWLDYTALEISYQDLFHAARTATHFVYPTYSLRRQDWFWRAESVKAICTFFGLDVTHIGPYKGVSGVKNMLFARCRVVRARRIAGEFAPEYERVGKLAYIKFDAVPASMRPARALRVRWNADSESFVVFVREVDAPRRVMRVVYVDATHEYLKHRDGSLVERECRFDDVDGDLAWPSTPEWNYADKRRVVF